MDFYRSVVSTVKEAISQNFHLYSSDSPVVTFGLSSSSIAYGPCEFTNHSCLRRNQCSLEVFARSSLSYIASLSVS